MKNVLNFNDYNLISEDVRYHLDNDISLFKNIYRPHSEKYYSIISECRKLYDDNILNLSVEDSYFFENTDLGIFHKDGDNLIPLDLPILNEAIYQGKEVELNNPIRNNKTGKKYKVYVKNPKTDNIMVVYFGDFKGGLKSKINDPVARRKFAERHKCSTKKDKTKPGYWSCRLPYYADNLGLKGGGNFYW